MYKCNAGTSCLSDNQFTELDWPTCADCKIKLWSIFTSNPNPIEYSVSKTDEMEPKDSYTANPNYNYNTASKEV